MGLKFVNRFPIILRKMLTSGFSGGMPLWSPFFRFGARSDVPPGFNHISIRIYRGERGVVSLVGQTVSQLTIPEHSRPKWNSGRGSAFRLQGGMVLGYGGIGPGHKAEDAKLMRTAALRPPLPDSQGIANPKSSSFVGLVQPPSRTVAICASSTTMTKLQTDS